MAFYDYLKKKINNENVKAIKKNMINSLKNVIYFMRRYIHYRRLFF